MKILQLFWKWIVRNLKVFYEKYLSKQLNCTWRKLFCNTCFIFNQQTFSIYKEQVLDWLDFFFQYKHVTVVCGDTSKTMPVSIFRIVVTYALWVPYSWTWVVPQLAPQGRERQRPPKIWPSLSPNSVWFSTALMGWTTRLDIAPLLATPYEFSCTGHCFLSLWCPCLFV